MIFNPLMPDHFPFFIDLLFQVGAQFFQLIQETPLECIQCFVNHLHLLDCELSVRFNFTKRIR